MKKIYIILVLAAFVCFCFTGCSEYADAWQQGVESGHGIVKELEYDNTLFEVVARDTGDKIVIFRDRLTDVLYMNYRLGQAGGLTVMVNSDGTPLLYSEWCTLREASANGD